MQRRFLWQGFEIGTDTAGGIVRIVVVRVAEFDLTNDGTNVVADWSELNIAPAKLTYTSEGVDYHEGEVYGPVSLDLISED